PAKLAHHGVLADDSAGRQRLFFVEELWKGLRNGLIQKGAGTRVMSEERLDLGADFRIVGFTLEPQPEILWLRVDSRFEQLAHPLPLCRSHRPPLNSRKSQARASAQRRLSVAGDISSAAAASSIPRPTK